MKIGDIEVGGEYAVHDDPKASYRSLPRMVKVVEIVTVEEEYWSGSSFHSERKKRNVKRVKVEFLDLPTTENTSYNHRLTGLAKGTVKVLEARLVIAPWSAVRDDVKKRIEMANARDAEEAALEARVKALGFKGARKDDAWVQVREYGGELTREIEFSGKGLDRILELAEAGLAARGS